MELLKLLDTPRMGTKTRKLYLFRIFSTNFDEAEKIGGGT